MREDQLLWQYNVSVHVQWSKIARMVQTLLDGYIMTPGLGKQGQLSQGYQLQLQHKILHVLQSAGQHCKRLIDSNLFNS